MSLTIVRPARAAAFAAAMLWATGVAAMEQQKHDDIKAVLEITGSLNNAQMVINFMVPQIIESIRKANASIPADVMKEFEADAIDEFRKAVPDIVEPMIEIYDGAFSGEEIKELLQFYRSPIGQKVITQMPQLLQKSMTLGQSWGQQVAKRVVDRISAKAKEKGIKL